MTDTRTPEDKYLGKELIDDFNSPLYENFLNTIFAFGSIPPRTVTVVDGFAVKLKVLSPVENIEIGKKVDELAGLVSKESALRIETLARSIQAINGQLLRFSDTMVDEWKEFRGITDKAYTPSEVEQQRFLIAHRFNNYLINLIYDKYVGLLDEQKKVFEDLKKK